jgi:hypothetical protein
MWETECEGNLQNIQKIRGTKPVEDLPTRVMSGGNA